MAGLFDLYGDNGGGGGGNWSDALYNNRNSLVGLGLGLMSYPTMELGLKGYEQGAAIDSRSADRRAALMAQAREHGLARQLQRDQMAQNERHFQVTSQLPQMRAAEAMGLKPGTPEHTEFLKSQFAPQQIIEGPGGFQYYAPKYPGATPQPVFPGTPQGYGSANTGGSTGGTNWPSASLPAPGGAVGAEPSTPSAPPVFGYGPSGYSQTPTPTPSPQPQPQPQQTAQPSWMTATQNMPPAMAKTYRETAAKETAKRDFAQGQSAAGKEAVANVFDDDVNRAMNIIDKNPNSTTGRVGVLYGKMSPQSPAGTLASILDSLRVNSAYARLQEARDAAAGTTGTSMRITQAEFMQMQNSLGNLDQSRNPEELKYNLARAQKTYHDIVTGQSGQPGYQAQPTKLPPSLLYPNAQGRVHARGDTGAGSTFIRDANGNIVRAPQ